MPRLLAPILARLRRATAVIPREDAPQVVRCDRVVDLNQTLGQIERSLIEQALVASNGVVAQAARLLRLGRTTLLEKMRKYEIERSE